MLAVRCFDQLLVGLFLAYAGLDYLDRVRVRILGSASVLCRAFDRAAEYGLLLTLSLFCIDVLPTTPLLTKLILDLVLTGLFLFGRGLPRTRVRTGLTYSTLLALLFVSQGRVARLVTPEVATYILWAKILYTAVVVLYNAGILRKRYIADALSAGNLVCGMIGIWFAMHGRVDVTLLFMMLGAVFDGFDGAAARKFGGSRWWVYPYEAASAVH